MPLTIRGRLEPLRGRGAARATAGTLFAAFAVLVAAPANLAAADSSVAASKSTIVVTAAGQEGVTGKLTLAQALAQAAQDWRDNVIQFDPAVFPPGSTIRLTEAIAPSSQSGQDRLEGPQGSTQVILDASACSDAGVIVGDKARFAVSNLTIQGGQQRSVLLKDQGQLFMANVTVRASRGPGLAMFGQSRLRLEGCRIVQAQTHGLEIHGNCSAVLDEVTISSSQQSGIAGFEHSSVTARGCRLERNGHWNLVLTGSAKAELEGSSLAAARFANVDVSESSALIASKCVVEAGERFGIFATGQASARIGFSRIRANGSRGIEMQGSAALSLEGCEIDANRDYGAILFEQCSITAAGTKFTRNQGHGVSMRGQSSGQFEICLFAGNRYSGLGCMDAEDGGKVSASQCLFQGNGMRPIYRGPFHLDPLVPTPLSITDTSVECMADPNATIELYLDRSGEASRYLKTLQADVRGRFMVRLAEVPPNWAMSATATSQGSTSEFNVIAGALAPDVLGALLARTGPLSDAGGHTDLETSLRRWRPNTRLILHIAQTPSTAVERYARFMTERVSDWTCGAVNATLWVGPNPPSGRNTVVIPIEYLQPDAAPLLGRGGVTFMKWDSQGYFVSPMKIMLAMGKDPQETCPRVLAHEFGHVLGLCHTRVGLLSRMQGSTPPGEAFVNDFSPMLTFYDVLALHILHRPEWNRDDSTTLRQLVRAGALPAAAGTVMASAQPHSDQPSYSPAPAEDPEVPAPRGTDRP